MKYNISTVSGRKNLKDRSEPYWQKLSAGRHLGLRITTDKKSCSWKARLTVDGIPKSTGLGLLANLSHEEAVEAAHQWFKAAADVVDASYTVESALNDYYAHLRAAKTDKTANDAKARIEKHMPQSVMRTKLIDLKAIQVTRIKNKMAESLTKSTVNRTLNSLKAALNHAYDNQLVASNRAWSIKNFKDADESRILFLSDDNVASLLNVTTGAFHNLVKTAVLTGARYGELATARVSDLGDRTLTLSGKTGTRTAMLSKAASKHLQLLSKDKLPAANLLTKDDGTPWGKSHHSRAMKQAVIDGKLPRDTVFYSLRHYYISKALLSGMAIMVVAENCGTSVKIIERHYGKYRESDRLSMLDAVEVG